MKQGGDVLVVASCRPMASVSPLSTCSLAQRPFPTPSPFSFSVASTRWSSRPSIDRIDLVLRSFAFVLSILAAALLASSSSKNSFTTHSGLMYCFVVYVLVFVYSAFQLFKGVCDITQRGILISDKVSDYYSFILDQLAGYILGSSCSAAIIAIKDISQSTSLWKAAVASTTMSFATFLVLATCTLFSGYKLCKRIIW